LKRYLELQREQNNSILTTSSLNMNIKQQQEEAMVNSDAV